MLLLIFRFEFILPDGNIRQANESFFVFVGATPKIDNDSIPAMNLKTQQFVYFIVKSEKIACPNV
jgi:hypothetical protein